MAPGENTLTFTSYDGYAKAASIEMAKVEIGSMAFSAIEFLALDIPQVTSFDVVIGRSLLKFTRLELDYSTGLLGIEKLVKEADA